MHIYINIKYICIKTHIYIYKHIYIKAKNTYLALTFYFTTISSQLEKTKISLWLLF